jgi:hypothetical protein
LRPLLERFSRDVGPNDTTSFGDWAMQQEWTSLLALLPTTTTTTRRVRAQ